MSVSDLNPEAIEAALKALPTNARLALAKHHDGFIPRTAAAHASLLRRIQSGEVVLVELTTDNGYLPDGVWNIEWCQVEFTYGCRASDEERNDGDHANCGQRFLIDVAALDSLAASRGEPDED